MAGIKAERRKRGSSGQDAHNYKDIKDMERYLGARAVKKSQFPATP